MCGNHSADHSHHDSAEHEHDHSHHHSAEHEHDHSPDHRRGSMAASRPSPSRLALPRRAFLGEYGRRTLALAVFSPVVLAACSDDSTTGDTSESTAASTDDATADEATTTTAGANDSDESTGEEAAEPTPLQWARANLGFVSAYVLARANEAAIVDTGTAGSADAIGETLASLGLGYSDVGHVFLTHNHPDHIGATGDVLAQAEEAAVYVGEADAAAVAIDGLTTVTGGEDLFGLEVLATPGHTAGHIAVIDHDAGLLVAGDALRSDESGVLGPAPDFSQDIGLANDSVRRLAELSFNTLLVGHGDPIETGAGTAVVDLAATL